MKYIVGIFCFFLPVGLISYFNYENCHNETVFFVQSVALKDIELSSFYCDFGKTHSYHYSAFFSPKKGNFVHYDTTTKKISPVSKIELQSYLKRLKQDLDIVKRDSSQKEKIFHQYTKNYREHEDPLSVFFKNYLFSRNEQVKMHLEIQKHPYKIFEKSVGERLLMDGKIISREEWGADESYSKREVYMKGCENGSCLRGGPVAPNQLRDNYLKYFNAQDSKDRILKTFDDGRDPHRYYPVDRIIIHHTAGGYKQTKDEGMAYMRAVQKYHGLTLRWGDIGYHYLIDGDGNIYEGRAGGKYVLGSHVSTHNFGSIGISLMSDGYYSDEMLESLQKLIIYLAEEYDLDLTQKTKVRNAELTGWEDGWALLAHKELDSRKPKDPEIIMDVFRNQIIAKIKSQSVTLQKK